MPLFSVRSGAQDSMPGMMISPLNVGLTSHTKDFWTKQIGELSMLDCRRRLLLAFVEMSGSSTSLFTKCWAKAPNVFYGADEKPGTTLAVLQSQKHMLKIVDNYEIWYPEVVGHEMPDNLREQLIVSVAAVFDSWDSERAIEYRDMHGIDHDLGTAVNIQTMVYGNLSQQSCTGVYFTRDPATGEPELYGEWLRQAQGEDVVAGSSTPMSMKEMDTHQRGMAQHS